MSEEEKKLEERKKMNAPFIRAFEWYRTKHHLTQKKMCDLLRCHSPLISDYKNGKKLVGLDMKQRISDLFNGKIYMPFLNGLSPYMLTDNVPDDEIRRVMGVEYNPDYHLQQHSEIDQGSMFNAIIAERDVRLKEKDDLIEQLHKRIEEKDAIIIERDETISSLRIENSRLIAQLKHNTSIDYPFPPGVAELPRKKGKRV
jgi:transcriptional regulator with XRE-family HTH domain